MTIDPEALGRRIAEARTRSGLSQAELSRRVDLDRSALAKIELGQRRVSALELARLAGEVGTRIEWLLREGPPSIVSRRNSREPGMPNPPVDDMAERIAREVEFAAEHDERFRLRHIATHGMPTSGQEAEALAETARRLLGFEPSDPCTHLSTAAARIGLLVFSLDLGADSADAATVLLPEGGIALINGALPVGRRRLALAHELGHYLVADEYTVDWKVAEAQDEHSRERLFDRFARALLLPAAAVRADWERFAADPDGGMRTAAVRIASAYRVDMSTLARRLGELGVVRSADADRIRSIRTTRADIVELDLVVADELAPPELPREYERSVLRLFRAESVSAERALDLLLDTWTEDALPALPRRAEDELWQFL